MCSRSGIRAHKYRGTGSNYIHYPGRWAAGQPGHQHQLLRPWTAWGKNCFLGLNYFPLDQTSHRLHRHHRQGFGHWTWIINTRVFGCLSVYLTHLFVFLAAKTALQVLSELVTQSKLTMHVWPPGPSWGSPGWKLSQLLAFFPNSRQTIGKILKQELVQ